MGRPDVSDEISNPFGQCGEWQLRAERVFWADGADCSGNYTTHHFVYTPTIAFGKGWEDFDVQSTLGVSVPDDSGEKTLGTPIALNVTAQYRLAKYFWPEVEANYTYWPNGTHKHLNQLFMTPGLVLGKFPIWNRVALMFGVGCQVAVTDDPLYHRNLILTGRICF